jgi:hypothetical protein
MTVSVRFDARAAVYHSHSQDMRAGPSRSWMKQQASGKVSPLHGIVALSLGATATLVSVSVYPQESKCGVDIERFR